jgi:hypothetical protein
LSVCFIPRTSKKHGKGQADGGGYIFHTESLARIIWDEQGGMGASAIAKESASSVDWQQEGAV